MASAASRILAYVSNDKTAQISSEQPYRQPSRMFLLPHLTVAVHNLQIPLRVCSRSLAVAHARVLVSR